MQPSTSGGSARGRRSPRSLLWRQVRRWGLLPSGQADLLGEDDDLHDVVLTQRVVVFFADPPGALYQLEQWYETFRAVDARLGLAIFLQDSRTARAVRAAMPDVEVLVVARPSTVASLVERGAARLVLYVNHNPANFSVLRLTLPVHVSLLHGDSDKAVSTSNQLKAYDYSFVAGDAAVDRIGAAVHDYDARGRCVPVGRPQLDALRLSLEVGGPGAENAGAPAGPIRVLYAPTWEGADASVCYSSLVSHGPALVRALIDDGGFRVAYRPHPLSGVRDGSFRAADERVRATLRSAAGDHRVDDGVDLGASFAAADVLVGDVSAVGVDWLVTGRPQVMTVPAGDDAVLGESRLREGVPQLAAQDVDQAPDVLRASVADTAPDARRAELARYYLGEVSPGLAMARFVDACTRVVADREARLGTVAAQEPVDQKQVAPEGV